MIDFHSEKLKRLYFFGFLLSAFFIYFTAPIFERIGGASIFMSSSFIFILVFSLLSLGNNKKVVLSAFLISIPVLITTVSFLIFGENYLPRALPLASGAAFFLYVICLNLTQIFNRKKVNLNIILDAIYVYLLIGIFWGFLYNILDSLVPGSFAVHNGLIDPINKFIYFSMVTLTTLGYGDITPVTHFAQSLSTLEAMTGQVYMTVLVGYLVGERLYQKRVEDENFFN
ncbi:MAG: ion channel [Alphaproteobacteria bacterium]|jgi:hypothetical protein|nr:ion channel [Alphaproteobacteria bacterium]